MKRFQVLTGILDEDVCAQACQDFLLCSNYTFFGPSNPLKWVKLYRTESCPTWKMGIHFSFLMKTKRREAWIFLQVRLFPLLLLQRRLNWLRRLSCWSPTVPGDCWSRQGCWQTRGWLFKVVFMVNGGLFTSINKAWIHRVTLPSRDIIFALHY